MVTIQHEIVNRDIELLNDTSRRTWSRNEYFHPLLLSYLPDRCTNALDVGCGEGGLNKISRLGLRVIGIDRDHHMVELAESKTKTLRSAGE